MSCHRAHKLRHHWSKRHARKVLAYFKNNARKTLINKSVSQTNTVVEEIASSQLSHSCLLPNIDTDSVFQQNNFQNASAVNLITVEDKSIMNVTSDFVEDTFSPELTSFVTDSRKEYQKNLAQALSNVNHVQGNRILSVIRMHNCLSYLPKDIRTLLCTPRVLPHLLIKVSPGEYLHIGVEPVLLRTLKLTHPQLLPDILEIDISTDGAQLDKNGKNQIWPIQCRIANIPRSMPEVIGIYKGPSKPHSANQFFDTFVNDFNKVIQSGGVEFQNRKIPIRLRCFIADAPARAFILNHKNHLSSVPCSKCKVAGSRYGNFTIFLGINHIHRSNDEYAKCIDEDHHKNGYSPLTRLPLGLVSNVTFDYMHLVCLGVMKKLLTTWVTGKYTKNTKFSARQLSLLSKRLQIIAAYCPREFARRPTFIHEYHKFKATEHRQILLYTGVVVLKDILRKSAYIHFLFLHAALRILVSSSTSNYQLEFAKRAIEKFVERF